MKNELDVERIFSYAVALEQSGRQKNIIFCWKNIIYIMNSDKTIILRFKASKNEFPSPIGFFANDYDSSVFSTEEGTIVFLQKGEEFLRKKRCKVPNQTFQEVEDLFYKFSLPFYKEPEEGTKWKIFFRKTSLDLLNPDLSHIEFVVKEGKIGILQRDIYSGTIIQLERKPESEGLGIVEVVDILPEEMSPIGMRTNDFLSLFNFNDKVAIIFQRNYFVVEGVHNNMVGVVSGCLFDSIGTIENLQEDKDGRKIKKIGNSQQEIIGETGGKVILRRRK